MVPQVVGHFGFRQSSSEGLVLAFGAPRQALGIEGGSRYVTLLFQASLSFEKANSTCALHHMQGFRRG